MILLIWLAMIVHQPGLAILLYWTLLLDFSIFSMHISAYVLVFGRVLSEACFFLFRSWDLLEEEAR